MSDLIERLKAAIDARQQAVEGSGVLGWLTYRNADGSMRYTTAASPSGEGRWVVDGNEVDGWAESEVVHAEDQALAMVAAHREILAEHGIEHAGTEYQYCRVCHNYDRHDAQSAPCPTILAIAKGYGIED